MTPDQIAAQLHELGVEAGGVLLIHTAYRTIRPVEGGPLGLIRALRMCVGERGTLVMPSWGGSDDAPFDAKATEASTSLGVLPGLFWKQPGVLRSPHPHAFAAAGPAAQDVLRDPLPLPPHIQESPVGRVWEMDGQVLLLGVNHDADTTVHLAELLAGAPYRVPKYCTVVRNGQPVRVEYGENDHCCERFLLVDDWLREAGHQAEGPVGHGVGRLNRSRHIVSAVRARLEADPLLFLHPPSAGCEECDRARASV